MGWFDILKRTKLQEAWKKNLAANRKANQEDFLNRKRVNRYARHQNRKNRCDRCGKALTKYNRYETEVDTGSTYCKQCAEDMDRRRRDEAATA
tara:strand:+ start:2945 stop:3223 length:279 start_codon:yes stop_codon:yes gene_type:complete